MGVDRQAIYDAIRSRVAGVPGMRSVSYRLRFWNQVEASEQPCAFVLVSNQNAEGRDPGTPSLWVLRLSIYVYAFDAGPDGPTPILTSLVDAIQSAIEDGVQGSPSTLGGLATDARVTAVESGVDEAILDQGIAVIDVEVRTAG